MSIFAAVMTGKGTGAISTIQVFGDKPETIIKKIFKPAGKKRAIPKPGGILLGTITDEGETVDQVTIGCEGHNNFTINCHGNPLIVEMIMRLLSKEGANLVTSEELLTKTLTAERCDNTIAIEAKLAQLKAKTIEGAKIIANQIDAGLSKTATEWLRNINVISLDEIRRDAEQILKASQTAKLIIDGCTTAIAGPPNTGKSTLLNCLAGREKAIVTNIKGTTRDWVSAQCQIPPFSVELIDTAGLSKGGSRTAPAGTVTPRDTIEKVSQEKSVQMLEQADMVLFVLDNSQTADQLDKKLLEKIAGKKVLTVLNKSDLPAKFDTGKLPEILGDTIQISAKSGTGMENLLKKIHKVLGVVGFDLQQPICITSRQKNLLKRLKRTKARSETAAIVTELLNGRLGV